MSTYGACGPNSDNDATCLDSRFGDYYSTSGLRGSSEAHCQSSAPATATSPTMGNAAPTLTLAALAWTRRSATAVARVDGAGRIPLIAARQLAILIMVRVIQDPQFRRMGVAEVPLVFGATCQRTPFGNCCSPYGRCRSDSIYCDAGCQAEFGLCN
ncbi:hypothetical protein P152DRAFT_183081 [Eremomyces bilateralis CBS 781.70]|uniref:Chitin-binding type-1 domain-containing protein n=1 Tax=Eremomyces bilateralis CBS 781.70 TaxID=1392243 RepID=A0A6G1GBL0_9PEZI|nr:uncharacterized protein P152DRAFT_183081 [Eremomyces bilateralis CBS 781.70]KAF1815362.1 hypothetical protein P152DRAFT_183081 [Eremomyces bilateralis CBS 781.70]